MAVRVTEDEVKLILSTTLTDPQILAFITDASGWVDARLGDSGLPTATLTVIEKYLAAHLITMRDQRLKSVKFDDVAEVYAQSEVSAYLKTAMSLDPTGALDQDFGNTTRVRYRVAEGFTDEAVRLGSG